MRGLHDRGELRSGATTKMHDGALDPADPSTTFSLVGALALAAVHVAAGWLYRGATARPSWLSAGSGVSVAYVFVVVAVAAFGAHFLVNDRTLHLQYGRAFENTARWILAASLLLGWLLATLLRPPALLVPALVGLVAGGIILHVIDEELPEGREGRFSVFVSGTVVYSLLLLMLAYSSQRT